MTVDAVGGVWTYAMDLAWGLVGQGCDIVLAILGPAPTEDQRAEARRIPRLCLVETGLRPEWLAASPAEVRECGEALAAIAGSMNADIVHLNTPGPAAESCFPVPVLIACHSCVATWWSSVRGGTMPDDFLWRTELVARAYRSAAILVAPSDAFGRMTREAYDLSRSPIVVHNARRPMQIGSVPAPRYDVFTAGRLWDEGKGIAILDDVAARLSFPVHAAGPVSGPNGAQIKLRNVRTLGRLAAHEISYRLAAQPIFVSTARYEPFGLSVLEAAQAGCPLVLADIAAFRELWNGSAVFIQPGDVDGFATALQELEADPARRAALGEAAKVRAENFSINRQAGAMRALYTALLARELPGEAAL